VSVVQVTTTCGSREEADRLAGALVEERLAACAQVTGPVGSRYRWKGVVEQAEEWTCQLKTTQRRLPALLARIKVLHSYETPEILATSIDDGDPAYLTWVEEQVQPEP
jgi:periplasmic divalent cation tolerance protein